MPTRMASFEFRSLPGALPVCQLIASPRQIVALAQTCCEEGGQLVTLWGEDRRKEDAGWALCVVLQQSETLIVAELPLPADDPVYPDLSSIFPNASRLQRATYDLVGIRAQGGDERPWLRHAAWAADEFPLRRDAFELQPTSEAPSDYAFVSVQGEGVHEIPVGPVHAGTIEPGHFRFSVVGEKVLRLEERLGYVHKGIEKRFEGMSLEEGARLAARVSGDSAVAYAWAYAMAAEAITETTPSERASVLRGVLLERERIANHLGDLGALGNDAGLAFGLAQFSRLKEDVLRTNEQVFGRRYPMDAVVPGGVSVDVDVTKTQVLIQDMRAMAAEVERLRGIYDNHAGLQDRFMDAGIVSPDLAKKLGVVGLAARASGLARDWRYEFPTAPRTAEMDKPPTQSRGDVAARVAVRFDEITASVTLCRQWLAALPEGPQCVPLGEPARHLGLGGVEGWRGPVVVALRVDASGLIRRCHPHDPSWHNWPALEHAILDNIVPDFPLINKSFNLSYSGHDL